MLYAKSLVLTKAQELQWRRAPLPPLDAGQVLVKTIATAVSVGSEVPIYQGMIPGTYPWEMGYESYGVVVKTDRDVRNLRVGDRVLVSGLGAMGLLTVHFLRNYCQVQHIDAFEPRANGARLGKFAGLHQAAGEPLRTL